MMAQAMRRVWSTLAIPSRAAIASVMPGRVWSSSSRILAAPSMPSCSVAGCPVYGVLRDGDQADHVSQVFNGAVQPAGLWEAAGDAVFREDAV